MFGKAISVLSLALIAYYILGLVFLMGLFDPPLQFTNTSCTALRGVSGPEDMVRWNGFILTSNLNALSLWMWPSQNDPKISNAQTTPQGSIYVITGLASSGGKPSLKKAEMIGFPSSLGFHPHGLGLLPDANLLFVVNHAYGQGGERIEIFKLQNSQASDTVSVIWKEGVSLGLDWTGVVNDVVPVSETEFYMSRFKPNTDPIEGKSLAGSSQIMDLITITSGLKMSELWFCNSSNGEKDCKMVGHKGRTYNGLSASKDRKTIFAADVFDHSVSSFQRTDSNDLTLIRRYPLPNSVDNIEYDFEDNKLWMGGIADFLAGIKYVTDFQSNPFNLTRASSPSGYRSPGHVSSLNLTSGVVTTEVIHDGSLLGGISGGLRIGSSVLFGSFMDDGVLICDRPTN